MTGFSVMADYGNLSLSATVTLSKTLSKTASKFESN